MISDVAFGEKEMENIVKWCFKNSEKQIDLDAFNSRIDTCGFN